MRINSVIVAKFYKYARCAAALLLVFSMLLAVLPVLAQGESVLADSDIPEALSRAQLEEHGAVQRLYDEEQGDNDFVFLNRDGTITRYDFSVPVKYKDETGKYRDKNNKIKDWNGEYGNTAGDVELRFPKQLNFIKIKYNGHTVRIKPVTSASPGHLPAMVQGSSVSYAGAFGEGTELRYTSTMSGIKEDIILQNSAQGNSFSFEVRTGGLELRQQDGVWGIYDGETAVFSFGDLEVTDSFTGQDEATDDWDAHRTYAQAQVSALSGDKYIFTITVPQEYLQAESTVYPVYVDPTFNVSRSYIQDTYIAKGYTNNYVNSSLVAVGYGTNAKNVRTLAKISDTLGGNSHDNIGSGYNINEVSSVKYSMYCTSDYSSSPVVDVYAIAPMTSWDPSTVTWSNGAEQTLNGATLISSLTVKGKGRYEFDIKTAYNSWAFLGMNSGVLFKMRTEVSGKYRQFASANSSNSQQLPYIIVTYGKPVTMTISATNITLPIGGTTRLAASVFPQDIDTAINWESLDDSVATVDDNGVVRAVGVGEVSIIARSQYDPSVSVQCGVTVVIPVEELRLDYNNYVLNVGHSVRLFSELLPEDCTIKDVEWSSNDVSVASVDSRGNVVAHAPGIAIISAVSKQGNKSAECRICVQNISSVSMTRVGDASDDIVLIVTKMTDGGCYYVAYSERYSQYGDYYDLCEENRIWLRSTLNSQAPAASKEYKAHIAYDKLLAMIKKNNWDISADSDEFYGMWLHYARLEAAYADAVGLISDTVNTIAILGESIHQAVLCYKTMHVLSDKLTISASQYSSMAEADSAFSNISDEAAKKLGITDGASWDKPKRRTWRQTEKKMAELFSADRGYEYNRSYKLIDGELVEVPYGTKGSSRPDFYNKAANKIVEIKNYDITNTGNRDNLAKNIAAQYKKRIEVFKGVDVKFVIDTKGQDCGQELIDDLIEKVYELTGRSDLLQILGT